MNLKFWEPENNRPVLTIPICSEIDHQHKQEKVLAILAKAATTLATSGLLYKWTRYTGVAKLSLWNQAEKMFQFLELTDFINWLGQQYRILDSNNQEWLGPSRAVGDRLYAATLNHPSIPPASFKLQEERRRETA